MYVVVSASRSLDRTHLVWLYVRVRVRTHQHPSALRNRGVFVCVCVFMCVYVCVRAHTRLNIRPPCPQADQQGEKAINAASSFFTTATANEVCMSVYVCVCVWLLDPVGLGRLWAAERVRHTTGSQRKQVGLPNPCNHARAHAHAHAHTHTHTKGRFGGHHVGVYV